MPARWMGHWVLLVLGAPCVVGCGLVSRSPEGDEPGSPGPQEQHGEPEQPEQPEQHGELTFQQIREVLTHEASPGTIQVSAALSEGVLLVASRTRDGVWIDRAVVGPVPGPLTLGGEGHLLPKYADAIYELLLLPRPGGFALLQSMGMAVASELVRVDLDLEGNVLQRTHVGASVREFAAARGGELVVYTSGEGVFLRDGSEEEKLEDCLGRVSLAATDERWAVGLGCQKVTVLLDSGDERLAVELPTEGMDPPALFFGPEGLEAVILEGATLAHFRIAEDGSVERVRDVEQPFPGQYGSPRLGFSPDGAQLLVEYTWEPALEGAGGGRLQAICAWRADPTPCAPVDERDPEDADFRHLLAWVQGYEPSVAIGARDVGGLRGLTAMTAFLDGEAPSGGVTIQWMRDASGTVASPTGVVRSPQALGVSVAGTRPHALVSLGDGRHEWIVGPALGDPGSWEVIPGLQSDSRDLQLRQARGARWLLSDDGGWREFELGSTSDWRIHELSAAEREAPFVRRQLQLAGDVTGRYFTSWWDLWSNPDVTYVATIDVQPDEPSRERPAGSLVAGVYPWFQGPCAGFMYALDAAGTSLVRIDASAPEEAQLVVGPFEREQGGLHCDDERVVLQEDGAHTFTFLDRDGSVLGTQELSTLVTGVRMDAGALVAIDVEKDDLLLITPDSARRVHVPLDGAPLWTAQVHLRGEHLVAVWNDAESHLRVLEGHLLGR